MTAAKIPTHAHHVEFPNPHSNDTRAPPPPPQTHVMLGTAVLSGPLEDQPRPLHPFRVSRELHVMYVHLWGHKDEETIR